MGAFWTEKVEFFCQKGLQFVKQSAILICVANRRRNYARLAQLVEHLLDVQEVTGSSPVPSTIQFVLKPDSLRERVRVRFLFTGGFEKGLLGP